MLAGTRMAKIVLNPWSPDGLSFSQLWFANQVRWFQVRAAKELSISTLQFEAN